MSLQSIVSGDSGGALFRGRERLDFTSLSSPEHTPTTSAAMAEDEHMVRFRNQLNIVYGMIIHLIGRWDVGGFSRK